MFYAFKPDWTSGGPLDECDRKLSTKWQRNLHLITEKAASPQLYLNKIENLNATHPDWPFAIVRLGRAYLLLEDVHGALEQFEKALRLLSPLHDGKFERYVEGLRAYVKTDTNRDPSPFRKDLETEEGIKRLVDDEWANPADGVITSPWAPPQEIGQYRFSDASGASSNIKSAWESLLSEDSTGIMSSRYARLVCIETNEIEGVFALAGESLPRLVNVGFYTGAIDRVEAELGHGVQEPQKIVSILGDLQNGLDFLSNTVVKDPRQMNEDAICQIHQITMKSSRIGSHYDGENTIFYLTHPGVYRKRLITTSLAPEEIVQYTHQSTVPSEMNSFVHMMRASKCLEERDIPPFAAAAWIHATFARIHPFTDGNGRVSRLLASLPLIHAGYPFINVRVHYREAYLQALYKAQTTPDLQPLMDILASSMVDSIDYIRSLPPASPEDAQYRVQADLGHTRLSL
ncbi:hypothetical protein D9615_007335 [Tricholomella constricta]|uniref:protein adenylyltransferase n=1 Tax=Tricholomella constricta TaxID=117010 RepID=A0A8H5M0M5_9AGAR|nr:hypothetical protein D9615_007335 [Tricholomella constricta]